MSTVPSLKVGIENGAIRKKYARSQIIDNNVAYYPVEYLDKKNYHCHIDFLTFDSNIQTNALTCKVDNCCIEAEIEDGILTTFSMDGDSKRISSQIFVLPAGVPINGDFSAMLRSHDEVLFSFTNKAFNEMLYDKDIYSAICSSPNRDLEINMHTTFIITDGKAETTPLADEWVSVKISKATYTVVGNMYKENDIIYQSSKLYSTINPSKLKLPSCKSEFARLKEYL